MRRSLKYIALIFAFLAVLSLSTADSLAQGKGGGKGGGKGNSGGGKGNSGGGKGNSGGGKGHSEHGKGHGKGHGGDFDGRNPDVRFDGPGRSRTAWGHAINVGNGTVRFAPQDYRPSYDRHSAYYRGYWNGVRVPGYRGVAYGPVYGQGWGYGQGQEARVGLSLAQLGLGLLGGNGSYGYSPQGWGLGGWGLGSLGYSSGYLPYSNPYYVGAGTGIYNYARPIPVSYTVVTTTAAPAAGVMSSDEMLDASVAAFQLADYDKALDIVDRGIRHYPDDSVLHEFRALVLFARQDFQQAAATIHSVLAVGPGWNWATMSGLYGDVGLYTTHLRALEAYARENPENSGSRFLLAYHYMIGGHNDAVAKQLTQVVRLTPNDRVAADLLRMVSPPPALGASDAAQPPPEPQDAEPARANAVDPASLVGQWHATREGGAKFSLILDKSSNFKWVYAEGRNASEFEGKYTMEGNVLALERRDGGSMIARLTPDADGNLNFKLLGAPREDAGLTFTR